jgi:O-acetyl-ADP-ribose deacetylase
MVPSAASGERRAASGERRADARTAMTNARTERRIADRILRLARGDITSCAVDAIVNAANSSLAGGGGVDGAIHRAGGPAVMVDLEARYGSARHCPAGSAVIGAAGRLPARWVIHAVGPVWQGGTSGEADRLASAYRTSLQVAADAAARTIAFPAISCGIYGYPLDEGADIAVSTVAEHLATAGSSIEQATFILFSDEAFAAFARAIDRLPGGRKAAE